jgi:hypothetical protein
MTIERGVRNYVATTEDPLCLSSDLLLALQVNGECSTYHDDGPQGIVDKNDGTERQEGRAHDFILSTGLDRLQIG